MRRDGCNYRKYGTKKSGDPNSDRAFAEGPPLLSQSQVNRMMDPDFDKRAREVLTGHWTIRDRIRAIVKQILWGIEDLFGRLKK